MYVFYLTFWTVLVQVYVVVALVFLSLLSMLLSWLALHISQFNIAYRIMLFLGHRK